MSSGSTSTTPPPEPHGDRRFLITEILIAALIGIAFQEAVNAVRDSMRGDAAAKAREIATLLHKEAPVAEVTLFRGIPPGTVALFLVFSTTVLRFFIGNLAHLKNLAKEKQQSGTIWLFDLVWIVAQFVCIVFLGGLCSIELCRVLENSFVDLLVALFVLDLSWIASQWGLGRLLPSWRRRRYPWLWFGLNLFQGVVCVFVKWRYGTYYDDWMLWGLLVMSIFFFFVDVVATELLKDSP
jgi:hypothetical protein